MINNDAKRSWRQLLDERQVKEVEFSEIYRRDFHHGTDGHNAKLIIGLMADMLDMAESAGIDIQTLFHPKGDSDGS